jgi:hypothetical protein
MESAWDELSLDSIPFPIQVAFGHNTERRRQRVVDDHLIRTIKIARIGIAMA